MLRGMASKVTWVGRATVFMVGLAVILALMFGVASTALGANGDNFILGQNNTASLLTKLTGQVPGGAALHVVNSRTEPGSRGLQVNVAQNKPPIQVNPTAGKATNLNADKLDGLDSSDLTAAAHERTVVVSPVGSDTPVQNGQALLDALSGITDASAFKPYLLHIEPGTYDLADGTLTMKPWVDMEGSGELNTVITSAVSFGSCGTGTVNGADDSEMRFLTVRNTGAGPCQAAISNSFASPRLTHVTAEATGVGEGSNRAVYNDNAAPAMTDVTATASGGSLPDIGNVGVYNDQASPTIRQSKLSGSDRSLQQVGGTAKVALTQLVGQVAKVSGTLQCFGNYNGTMAAVGCP